MLRDFEFGSGENLSELRPSVMSARERCGVAVDRVAIPDAVEHRFHAGTIKRHPAPVKHLRYARGDLPGVVRSR
jgi:hypothetical protein